MEKEEKLTAEIIWKMFAETDKRRDEGYKRLEKQFSETDRQIKELRQEIGGVGKSSGEVAEDFFYHSFDKNMVVNFVRYDYLHRNLNKKIGDLRGEYDIVLVNSKSLLVVEVKYKLKSEHVTDFYTKRIPRFKKLFPEYDNYNLYAAVAGLSVDKRAEKEALKNKILLFTQSGQELKKLSPQDMKPAVF